MPHATYNTRGINFPALQAEIHEDKACDAAVAKHKARAKLIEAIESGEHDEKIGLSLMADIHSSTYDYIARKLLLASIVGKTQADFELFDDLIDESKKLFDLLLKE